MIGLEKLTPGAPTANGSIQNDSGLAQGPALCSNARLTVRQTGCEGERQMTRREFITLLGGAAVAWPLAARVQAAKVARIGYLITGALESPETRINRDAFRQGLDELGYIEGRNIVIEYRAADGKIERLPGLATELVGLKVDLIVALATPAGRAAQQGTSTIPIVVTAMGDALRDGLVASLARPGGNITGTTFLGPELVPKRLSFLRELLPTISRVAVLWHPGAFSEGTIGEMLNEVAQAARTLGVQLQLVEVRSADEFDHAFTTMVRARAEALFQFPSTLLFNERRRIVDLAARHRLPAMFNAREFVQLGGLIAYGANLAELNRRAAAYVDKILKGAKPSDLPVEQPTKFELFINIKTAKTLGIEIPPTLLARADEVIE
jgi:putative tryptophan/tyrosine transport system substrate-binding protein